MNAKYLSTKAQQAIYPDRKISPAINLAQLFEPRRNSYLNEMTLFTTLFNSIPNFIHKKISIAKKQAVGFLIHSNRKSKIVITTKFISMETKRLSWTIFFRSYTKICSLISTPKIQSSGFFLEIPEWRKWRV